MRNQVLYSIIGAAALFLVNACQKPVVNPPELKLPTTSFTDVSAAGDVVVVDYTLTNGVEGSEIKVDGDYDWAKVTAIKSASIEVTVDPNETTEPRTAEFDVTYPGVTKDLSFSITQAAGEAPVVDAPVITLEPTSAEVPAAGESGGFNYEIANPVDDGAVSCSVLYPEGDAGGWITCDEADAEADGRINYEVSANEGDARAATIVVSYPGAEDVDFVISQAAAGGEAGYDYEYTFVTFFAGYFDNETIETADNYNFCMSDGAFEPGDVQYNFDLYTKLASNGVLPAGTYTFDERTENYQPGTFSKFSNFGMAGEEDDPVAFKGGTITISKDESGNYSFEAELTDANDKTHHVTYTGPMDFGGGDEPSDEVSYEFEYSYLTFYEGEGQNGEDNFFLALSDMPFNADGYESDGCTLANFDIYAAAGTSGVLPAGTYRFDDYNYTEGTFSIGSYIRTPEKDYIYFSDGTINVSESGDEYIFEATLTGNDGITYKVTYTGAIAEPGAPSEPVTLEMKYHQVMYYEGYDSSESDEFCLSLSDMPFADDYGTGSEGSYVAWLDIYAPNGTSGVLPEGTYNYDDSYTRPPMSFVSGSTITYPGEDYGVRVSDGTIEVSKSADGKYSIEARLSLVDGNDYIVTYTGPVGEEGGDDPADMTFEISVDNITYDDYRYSIVPSNKETAYIHLGSPKEVLVGYGAMTEDGVINEYVLHDDVIAQFLQMYRDQLVHTGDLTDATALFPAASGQEVVVLCYGIDSGDNRITAVTKYEFTMPAMPAVITLDEETIEAGADGYTGGVYYSLGGDYDPEGAVTAVVENGADWIHATVDMDEAYISVTVDPNDTFSERSATVTVSHASAAEPAVLTVYQEAGELVLTENPNWKISYAGKTVYGGGEVLDAVTIEASDNETYLSPFFVSKADYDARGLNAIVEEDYASWESTIEYFGGMYGWSDFIAFGTGSYVIEYLEDSSVEYYALIYGVDAEGNFTGHYAISDPFCPAEIEVDEGYGKWIGNWRIEDESGNGYDVTIAENFAGATYSMTGWQEDDAVKVFGTGYPIPLTYDAESGNLMFPAGQIGSYNAGYVYFQGTAKDGSLVTGSYDIAAASLGTDGHSATVASLEVPLGGGSTFVPEMMQVLNYYGSNWYIVSDQATVPVFPMTMTKLSSSTTASRTLSIAPMNTSVNGKEVKQLRKIETAKIDKVSKTRR